MTTQFTYPGRELEAMTFAENYNRWILSVFKPFLGRHVVEVGAGAGSFSRLILEESACETLALVEPSASLVNELFARTASLRLHRNVEIYNSTLVEAATRLREQQQPDSIIYVNVLEHIADDEQELRMVHQTLLVGGRLFLFVPALEWLYGSFDESVGHVRRYKKRELAKKLQRLGFGIVKSLSFDFLGIAPWWISFCLFRAKQLDSTTVRFYDRFVVPAAARVETLVPPPIGKNVLLIAEKQ
ncbi:MAG TPA: class I SAM-dependent methyltransferase [Pyrinomonadaceae bacterium]|nr:class I SAM-dependent methyltransferase [Pyrinomonadaceae bacterium]